MTGPDDLADQIQAIGFSCNGCSTCCRRSGADSGLVMVTCKEVRAIMAATGLPWEEVAVPYPEVIDQSNGVSYTLGWCLRQEEGICRFLANNRCMIYKSRPWICRTYPFMLDGEELMVSACDGVGGPVSREGALSIAGDLLKRRAAEDEDAILVRRVLADSRLPGGNLVVIDAEGVKVVHG